MSWWNNSWSYRKKLTFDNSGQSENLLNFPVLVKLTTSNFDFSKAQSAGQDIRFVDADDSTELKYEIEKWTDDTEAWIWVKVPQIDGSSDTDFIYMYFGNAGASDNQDAPNVWDSDFKAVYHLNKASGAVVDSKGAHDGTNVGATRDQDGQIDKAFGFDGIDDRVEIPYSVDWDVGDGDFTIEAWITRGAAGHYEGSFLGWHTGDGNGGWCFMVRDNSAVGSGPWRLRGYAYLPGWNTVEHETNVTLNTLYYTVFRRSGSDFRVFLNALKCTTPLTSSAAIVNSAASKLWMGCRYDATAGWSSGKVDEVRISKGIARSDDWISAQYLSMTLAFITFGGEETGITSKTSADSGSGAETLGSRLFGMAETGSGIGVSSLLATLIGTEDSGLGSEFAAKILSALDSGSGTEAHIARLLAATETGSALEAAFLIKHLFSSDYGLGGDAIATLLALVIGSEVGSGSEQFRAKIVTFPGAFDMRLLTSAGEVRIPSKGVNL